MFFVRFKGILIIVLTVMLCIGFLSACKEPITSPTQTSTLPTIVPGVPGLTSIQILPVSPPVMLVDEALGFRAVGVIAGGNSVDISSRVAWASSNEQVVTFEFQNMAKGVAPGVAYITASLSGVTSEPVTINVVKPLNAK
jgi:hypothetical protein